MHLFSKLKSYFKMKLDTQKEADRYIIPTISKDPVQANQYDIFQQRFHGLRGLKMRSKLIRCITDKKDCKLNVLDCGSGTGDISIRVAQKFQNAHIVSLDASVSYLNVARRKVRDLSLNSQIQFCEMDITSLNAKKIKNEYGSFDYILSQYALHYDFNHLSLFKTFNKSLNHGGKVIIGINISLNNMQVSDKWWADTTKNSYNWHLKHGYQKKEAIEYAKKDTADLQTYSQAHVKFYKKEQWINLLRDASFRKVKCIWQEGHDVIIQAMK